jgi:hypothetical protein
MIRTNPSKWAILCLLLTGCVSTPKDPVSLSKKQLSSDFRLILATESEITELVRKAQCKILVGPDMLQTNWNIGTRLQLNDVLRSLGSTAFAMESRLVVLQRDSILRRPAWYETTNALERVKIGGTVISPGDVIWFPPVE